MTTVSKTRIAYREADRGRFISKEKYEKSKPETVIKERLPKPGFGLSK